MVAQLLRLKLQLTANIFRRSALQNFLIVLAFVVGIAVVGFIVSSLIGLRGVQAGNARDLLVVAGSFTVLGFVLLPIVFVVEDELDPRKFSLFGIPSRSMATGLFLAALIGIPALALAVVSLSTVVTWSRGPLPVTFAIISAVLAIATCVLATRITTIFGSFTVMSRRSREMGSVFVLLVIVLVAPAIILVAGIDWENNGETVFARAADVVSWTPFGAVWAIPGDAADGDTGSAIAKLLIAVATVVVLWIVWERLVAYALRSRTRERHQGSFGSLGWFDAVPARPAAVVAARSLTYWARDSRYIVSILIIPVLPFILIPPLLIAGIAAQPLALLPLPVMCLFLGWSLHNDLAYDSTSVWLHVVSGVRGTSDRIGRMVPTLIIGIPVVVVGAMVSTAFFGDWNVLPAVIGVGGCLLLAGIGVSSFLSARFPYPASAPGDSPFQQPQSGGALSAGAQTGGLLCTLVLGVPAMYLSWLGFVEGAHWFTIAMFVGLGVGILSLVAGVLIGGRVFDRRGPEIMSFATSH